MEPQNSTVSKTSQESLDAVSHTVSSQSSEFPNEKPGGSRPLASDQPASKPLPPGIVRDAVTGQLKSLPGNKLGPKPGVRASQGQQRSTPITDALAAELGRIPNGSSKTLAELLAGKLIKIAAEDKGRLGYEAILTIMERVDGRVPIRQEVTGQDGQPMQLETVGTASEAQGQLMAILARIAERSETRVNTGEMRNVTSSHSVIEGKRIKPTPEPIQPESAESKPEPTTSSQGPTSARDRFQF